MSQKVIPDEWQLSFPHAVTAIIGAESAASIVRKFQPLSAHFAEGLTGEEALAIYVYTTPMEWYLRINRELRSGSPSPEIGMFSIVLDAALRKLRPFQGLVYRAITVADPAPFLLGYPVGHRLKMPAFTSAARKLENVFSGNILFTVRSRTAAIIWMWSADLNLDEVVFGRNTVFEVISVAEMNGKVHIALDEVSNDQEDARNG